MVLPNNIEAFVASVGFSPERVTTTPPCSMLIRPPIRITVLAPFSRISRLNALSTQNRETTLPLSRRSTSTSVLSNLLPCAMATLESAPDTSEVYGSHHGRLADHIHPKAARTHYSTQH